MMVVTAQFSTMPVSGVNFFSPPVQVEMCHKPENRGFPRGHKYIRFCCSVLFKNKKQTKYSSDSAVSDKFLYGMGNLLGPRFTGG